MALLEHPKAQALLEDAVVSRQMVVSCREGLTDFVQRYLPWFHRSEQRQLAQVVLAGKVGGLERKTCEPIAIEAGRHRKPVQNFVGAGAWNDDTVLGELRRHVAAQMGRKDAVLALDPSAFPKKGKASCGVGRQWCGRLGKLENCQVGVFLGYVTDAAQALVDRQLYLPEDWAGDADRREATHVPDEVFFQEKWRIALDLLDRSGAALPHEWVTGDDEFGRSSVFRGELRLRKEKYVLDAPCNTLIRQMGIRSRTFVRVDRWASGQPKSAWKKHQWRLGEKGPVTVNVLDAMVQTRDEGEPGPSERLLVIRTVEETPQTWYCLSNDRQGKRRALLSARAKHHGIEQLFQTGKGETGLDHYEVRSWVGWHHHMTLSLLAMWFLETEKQRVEKKRQR